MLSLHDVWFSHPDSPPLFGPLNFAIQPGERVALIGPSGSGKSTLARLLNGLEFPTGGHIEVDGISTHDDPYHARRTVGMVFQDPQTQLLAQTVEDELAFGLENLNLPAPEIQQRVDATLDQLHLDPLRQRDPHLLSGGQKQKVAIASVLITRPAYLVLDEPTSMLDAQGRRDLFQLLDRLEVGLIFITHQAAEIARMQRVISLAPVEFPPDPLQELAQRLGRDPSHPDFFG